MNNTNKRLKKAYKNVIVTLNTFTLNTLRFLLLKGFKKPEEKQQEPIECHCGNLGKFDIKMLAYYNNKGNCNKVVHLWIYYDGIGDSVVLKRGLDSALIKKIKPFIIHNS